MFEMLNPEEISVELVVRGINPNTDDCLLVLSRMIEEEVKNPRSQPRMSHEPRAELEIGSCREIVEELNKLGDTIQYDSDMKTKETALAKAVHWYNRALRAKNSFGDVMQISQIANKLRRCVKNFELLKTGLDNNRKPTCELDDEREEDEANEDDILDRTLVESDNYSPKNPESSSFNNANVSQTNTGTIPKPSNPNYNKKSVTIAGPSTKPSSGMNLQSKPGVFNSYRNVRRPFNAGSRPERFYYTNANLSSPPPPLSFNPLQFSGYQSLNQGPIGIPNYQQYPYSQQQHTCSHIHAPNPLRSESLHQSGFEPNQSTSIVANRSRGYSYKKPPNWKLLFDGTVSPNSLDVHDFVFRLETYAEQDDCPFDRLPALVHNFVGGSAEKWVWNYKRGHSNCTWNDFKRDLLNRFSSHESDRTTRRMLERRIQKPREAFNDFVLEMEATNWRLEVPFDETELLEIIRENMSPALQNVTVAHRITSIEALRSLCLKFETLWTGGVKYSSTGDSLPTRRLSAVKTNDIHKENESNAGHHLCSCILSQNVKEVEPRYNTSHPEAVLLEESSSSSINLIQPSISTIAPNSKTDQHPDPTLKLICWNCRDMGHRYQDCQLTLLHIFCFGCGLAGYIKPQCPNCLSRYSGKGKPSVFSREMHSTPQLNPGRISQETVATNTEPQKYR